MKHLQMGLGKWKNTKSVQRLAGRPSNGRRAGLLASFSALLTAVVLVALLVATASVAETSSSNASGTSGLVLPDGRAYEQVSPGPREKNGAGAAGGYENVLMASPNGDAVSYFQITGTGTESSASYPIYVAARNTDGWTADGINPPASLGVEIIRLAFTEDMKGSFTVAGNPIASAVNPYGFYFRESGGKVTKIAPASFAYDETIAVASESEGGNLVIFEDADSLTSGAIEGLSNVYVWNKSTGAISLVDKLPDGSTPEEGGYAGPWNWYGEFGGGALRGAYTKSAFNLQGTRAFFTDGGVHQIYMRNNPSLPTATTTLISATQKTNGTGPGGEDPNGQKPADFLEATSDGRYVFFKSRSALTNDSNTGPNDEGQDLYRYDADSGTLLDIAPLGKNAGTEVLGLAGLSRDGTYAYFVAKADLAGGAIPGEENLYMWHEGSPVQFVTTINPGEPGREPGQAIWIPFRQGVQYEQQRAARVSTDGRTVAFLAVGPPAVGNVAGKVPEIYRWEAGGPGLQCLSCNPVGETTANASLQRFPNQALKAEVKLAAATRNLSLNGRRAIFVTEAALVPTDVNEAEDVYEWEAPGEGSCVAAQQNGGCLFLMSTGSSPHGSYFVDASADGSNVFFLTDQRLVASDRDELSDVYDARIGGGLASQSTIPVAPCEGEECLGAGTVPSPSQPKSTAGFVGPGNPKQVKCKQGFHRKHGKCVAKRRHKKHNRKRRGKKANDKNVTKRSHEAGGR